MRRDPIERRARAFTLTELLVVIAIIGILTTFILIAAADGTRRAQEKATHSLISKLEIAVSERVDAILYQRADVYPGHFDLASIYTGSSTNPRIDSSTRAQVIAQADLVRALLPDVFFVMSTSPATTGYPINFAGLDYPLGSGNYNVPLGSPNVVGNQSFPPLGVYGATYQAAGGLYKNLGYLPAGYDGADNNNNGLIDEWGEGVNASNSAAVTAKLSAHTHNTARSEMLYAILVEGQGPLGSAFTREDFSSREVADTDGDGLPEFIDAWGQPLQFYRWPIYYNPDGESATTNVSSSTSIQKGLYAYSGNINSGDISEVRQVDTLDPNQTLVSIGWWLSGVNSSPPSGTVGTFAAGPTYSSGAVAFMQNFHSLLEPYYQVASPAPTGAAWDRSGATARRSFYSRFLIVSSGPDQQLGIAQLNQNYQLIYPSSSHFGGPPLNLPLLPRDASGALIAFPNSANGINYNVKLLTMIENQAAALDPNRSGTLTAPFGEKATYYATPGFPYSNDTTAWLISSGLDDITNQGLASPGGGVR